VEWYNAHIDAFFNHRAFSKGVQAKTYVLEQSSMIILHSTSTMASVAFFLTAYYTTSWQSKHKRTSGYQALAFLKTHGAREQS
jgi:hypothetical protein